MSALDGSRFVEVGGVRMRWEERGEGSPAVFVHGIPTSPRLWRRVFPLLPDARCLAWEMVGYGASIGEGQNRDISVAKQADYLARWMGQVGLSGGAVVVGHDLGGGVAQVLAVRHPELVKGLVLTNAVCYDSWPVAPVKAVRSLGAAFARLPDGVFRLIYRGFMLAGHDDLTLAGESLGEHLPFYLKAGGAAAFVRQARSLDVRDTQDVANRLPGLHLPARIVWGAADRFQPIGYGYRLAHDLGARLERVEGGKHFVPEDHPEPVARAVRAVLERAG